MIKLDPATIAAHPLMAELKSPPTHAKLVDVRHTREIGSVLRPAGFSGHDRMISALYAFGTLDESGAFVPSKVIHSVATLVSLAPHRPTDTGATSVNLDGVDPVERAAAAANLVGAGVAPTPGAPHVPLAVPAKRAGSFRDADLDAVVAHYCDAIKGTVVPD